MSAVYGYQPFGGRSHVQSHSYSHSFELPQYQQVGPPPMYLPPPQHQFGGQYNNYTMGPSLHQQQQQHMFYGACGAPMPAPVAVPVPAPQDQDAVTGGVSPVLDYDLDIMTKFVAYLSHRLFGRHDTENPRFVGQMKAVLGAVRLPKSSMMLACYYLLDRYEKDSILFNSSSDELLYEITVLALALANKANDDHTFINKSWSQATGLSIMRINSLEATWLAMIEWKLHKIDMTRFNELTAQFDKYTININKHQEQIQLQQQQQQQQQQFAAMSAARATPGNYHYSVQEPVSPVSMNSESSPIYNSGITHQSPWAYQQLYNNAGFGSYGHQKSYSWQVDQFEPSYYCSKTGLQHKSQFCSCTYCSSSVRGVEWNSRLGTAC
ncbi:CLG1 [Cyberlindnera jadinii]|uniref:CLG1 protein n=2 Tax=Cyberlindnera jadinii (strain ATCC 18201 / CBS 1600 / BCRC 20928 / JCM 3617 / NBRC 0987 / NRRL Y-1542) TaxID=983966 RepID=A0A0H5C5E9_CYBJN|nr:CLG1 [Cyberlindnera jadinii]